MPIMKTLLELFPRERPTFAIAMTADRGGTIHVGDKVELRMTRKGPPDPALEQEPAGQRNSFLANVRGGRRLNSDGRAGMDRDGYHLSMRGTLRRSRWRWLLCIALAPLCRVAFALDCSDPLFTCESERASKYISICATEVQPGSKWEDIQYRFGAENQKPELVFPADASKGASMMYFSHVKRGSDYRVSVRFSIGSYTYRVFSTTGPDLAGVSVTDRQGKLLSTVRCIERPRVFPTYLQRALPCDLENPHGKAACGDRPYAERK